MRRLGLLAALVPAAALLTGSVSASASTGSAALVTFTGSVTLPASTGLLVIEAEQGDNLTDAKRLTDVPVASETISSDAFSLPVQSSGALSKAEVHGWVQFAIVVESGQHATVQNISVPMTSAATNGNASVTAELASHTVQLPAFPAFVPASVPKIPVPAPCVWVRYGREHEVAMRIGQFHLTKLKRLSLAWDYGVTADTTASVGYSNSSDKGWTIQGSYTSTNTIGANSGFTKTGRMLLRFVDGDAYFQRYQGDSKACPYKYKNKLDHMVGDSWLAPTGTNTKKVKKHPKANPYGGCLKSKDPYGNARVVPGDHYGSDRDQAATIDIAGTVFGFSFDQSTGFSNDIHENYSNNNRHTTVYVCGTNYMPNVPIEYNNGV
jgi:hypothetical protein